MRFASVSALLFLALCLSAPLALTRVGCGDVLWDQLSGSGYGFYSQDFEEEYDSYDCLAADDFTVPEPGWVIDTVEFTLLLYYGGNAPIHGMHIYIMPDRGDNLGDYYDPVYYEFAPVDIAYVGTNTVTLATPVVLAPGHYFFGAAPALDYGSYSKSFLVMSDSAPVGQEAHMINPGGGFGHGPDWFQPSPGYDASFRLYGQIFDVGLPDAVIDLPLGNVVIPPGRHVLFAGTATDGNGEIVDWLWTFGEGSGIDDVLVEDPGYVQFNNLGAFEVTFNAQDNDGNWDPIPGSREVWVRFPRTYVDQDSPGPEHDGLTWDTACLTVQQGTDAATRGGEVWVADGTYVENIVMGEGVQLYGGFLGAEPGGYEDSLDQRDFQNNIATIDGHQSGSCVVMAVDARVDGFTVTNGIGSLHDDNMCGGGFFCLDLGDSGAIANNTIVGNSVSGHGGGIWCHTSSPLVTNNTITGNSADRSGGGLRCTDASPAVTSNTIAGNSAGWHGGGICCYGSSPTVRSNVITANSALCEGGGIHCRYPSTPTVTGNLISQNTARNGGGVYAETESAPTISGNDLLANTAEFDGGAIGSSGASPAVEGNTISGNAARWGGAVCLRYSSPAVTDNTIADNTAEDGGGILCNNSSPTIANNTISSNTASAGGGIQCEEQSSPTVTNNLITGNIAQEGSGVSCYLSSSPTVTNNTISGNAASADGGGIWCEQNSSPTVTSNTITGNIAQEGSGVYCRWLSSPTVTNNMIRGNTASARGGGVFCTDSSHPTLTNNTITRNSSPEGGGIQCHSPPWAANNIITSNTGAGVYSQDGRPWLSHNDVWNNSGGDYVGCGPGDGDISDDPMFVHPEAGDFHLDPASPCIDMGDNDAPGLPEMDFEGDPRIVDGDGDKVPEVDIGADECVSRCWPTEAPDPEPYCDGPLFGEPGSGYPGWVWFSIPLDPSDCCEEENCYDPKTLLGFGCSGRLWYWDTYGKTAQVYQPPFLQWDLAVGNGYLLYLESAVDNPSCWGEVPPVDFEVRLGRQGWTWVGVPALYELGYVDFMSNVCVQYPVGGVIRTAGEDYAETPGNWLSWGWPFWDTYSQAPRTFTPYLPFGNNTCYPWIGYRLWVNVGAAQSADDPDQVTLIWP